METNGLAQKKKKKKKKKSFYFLTKIPNLNIYQNQNGKSMFPNCIHRFGRQKKETTQKTTTTTKKNKKKIDN